MVLIINPSPTYANYVMLLISEFNNSDLIQSHGLTISREIPCGHFSMFDIWASKPIFNNFNPLVPTHHGTQTDSVSFPSHPYRGELT